MGVDHFPLVVVSVAVAIAAVSDLRTYKIRDVLTLPLLITGLAYHVVVGTHALSQSGLGVAVALALTLPGFLIGGMGAGDVKLMAGIGAWIGPLPTLGVFLAASLATAAYALVAIAIGRRFRETWTKLRGLVAGRAIQDRVKDAVERRDRLEVVPFATMTGVGLLVLVLVSVIWLRQNS